MRRPIGGWAVLLVCVTLTGCLWEETRRPGVLWERLRRSGTPSGPDVVVIEIAVIERPLDDTYLGGEVWGKIDEQILGGELKALVDENGLRVGLIAGMVPEPLQNLLVSDRNNANSRRVYLRAGNLTPIVLRDNKSDDLSSFDYLERLDSKPLKLDFEKAACGFGVTPSITEDGRVRLRCVPRVEHGERKPWAVKDGEWAFQGERPVRAFDPLAWDITLSPNEYLVVGPSANRPGTIGHHFFTDVGPKSPCRKLLMVRLGQAVAAGEPLLFGDGPQPIAAQATVSKRTNGE